MACAGARQWFKLTIAYDGSDYAGWQVQPGELTVQGMLERALVKVIKKRVPVTGSGRTDSGVHALGQVASIALDNWRASCDALCRAINSRLPRDICVLRVESAPYDFHAIRDCIGKRYRYRLQAGGMRDPFDHRYLWHVRGSLDVDAMSAAAQLLLGQHDFACFQATGSARKSTVRCIRDICVATERSTCGGQTVVFEVEADGFLYNMVRNIVGTLVDVGRQKYPPSWIQHLVQSQDRTLAGQTAPPHGLYLLRADYAPPTCDTTAAGADGVTQ